MAKPKYTWIENFQKGLGLKVSRMFFYSFTSREIITKALHPETHKNFKKRKPNKVYIDKNIQRLCFNWADAGFLEKSRDVPIRDRWGRTKTKTFEIMNLEPIYKFCKEKGIKFEEKEKFYFNWLTLNEDVRKTILDEFPEADIITATLYFYLKNCIIRYAEILKDIMENPEKYGAEKKKVEEMNNPKTKEGKQMKKWHDKISAEIKEKYGSKDEEEERVFTIADLVATNIAEGFKDCKNNVFWQYVSERKHNREVVEAFDKKVLQALKLYPSNKSKRYYAPAEQDTILTNQRGIKLYASIYKLLLNKKQQEVLQ